MKKSTLLFILLIGYIGQILAQSENFTAVRAGVDFSANIHVWDGFGFNYVETAHFIDKNITPELSAEWWENTHPGKDTFMQEYGGFSLLNEVQKKEILNLVFGVDGLKPGIVKMFLGADHQKTPKGPYDHESTTGNMRYFVREGLKITRQRGEDFQIITTLYGPPGFMTLQKKDRGRDLDCNSRKACAYLAG